MKIDFARAQYGEEEKNAVNRVLESQWLASGQENELFEKEFAEHVGSTYAICCNSGSSANLMGLASLNLPSGSRVLTSACGFPATLAPILHLGFEPVLVDYDLRTHNISVDQVIKKIPKVNAIILAHTLGNPVEIDLIKRVANIHGVKVIEDCCEAVGSYITGKPNLFQHVGTIGDIGTFSFYPSHQITAGGAGGMVVTNDREIMIRCKSMRDWGKLWNWDEKLGDNKTFYDQEIEGLDYKYYRHYTYQTVGYNFKLPEMCAAFGREQLKKLKEFANIRNKNYRYFESAFSDLDDFIQVQHSTVGYPNNYFINWFGYVFTIRDGSKLNRNEFGDYLESKGIRHRPFFAGNIAMQPAFEGRINGLFPVADKLMKDSLFIGCWNGMTQEMLDYIVKTVRDYVNSKHTEL